jgi:hypothetical protein
MRPHPGLFLFSSISVDKLLGKCEHQPAHFTQRREIMGIIGRTLVKGIVALSTGICIVMVSVMVGYVVYDHNMAAGEVSQWAELQALFMGTAAYLGIIWGILWVSEETKSILHQVLTFIFLPLVIIVVTVFVAVPIGLSLFILAIIAALAVYKVVFHEAVQQRTA